MTSTGVPTLKSLWLSMDVGFFATVPFSVAEEGDSHAGEGRLI